MAKIQRAGGVMIAFAALFGAAVLVRSAAPTQDVPHGGGSGAEAAATVDQLLSAPLPADAVVVPFVAHLPGMRGSQWSAEIYLKNTATEAVTLELIATNHNTSRSGTDPTLSLTLQPVGTAGDYMALDDAYSKFFPGSDGKAQVLVNVVTGRLPLLSVYTYSESPDGGTIGFLPAPMPLKDYWLPGTIAAMVTPDLSEFRASCPFVYTAGDKDVRITWTLLETGRAPLVASRTYKKNSMYQHVGTGTLPNFGPSSIFGAALDHYPIEGSILQGEITQGNAMLGANMINNQTNDTAYQLFTRISGAAPPPPTPTPTTTPCTYVLLPTARTLGPGHETGSFSVTAPAGCAWTATSNVSWLGVTAGSTGSGPGTVSYSVEANPTTAARSATITVQGQTFTVTQVGELEELTLTLPGGVQLVMVEIPAGTFTMGSPDTEPGRDSDEGPQHQVTISQDFYLGETEVTQAQWQAVMGSNPSYFSSCGATCPVEQVSWNDVCGGTTGWSCLASSFIGKVNQLLGSTKFRLPTEAEWEHAARAGTTSEFSFTASASWDIACGSFPEALAYMWWCNNAGSTTHPVGQKLPNPWGLLDVHGNVWEWVGDWYDRYYYASSPPSDPRGSASGSDRVIRGGSWLNRAQNGRSAFRNRDSPDSRGSFCGFRLARSQ